MGKEISLYRNLRDLLVVERFTDETEDLHCSFGECHGFVPQAVRAVRARALPRTRSVEVATRSIAWFRGADGTDPRFERGQGHAAAPEKRVLQRSWSLLGPYHRPAETATSDPPKAHLRWHVWPLRTA